MFNIENFDIKLETSFLGRNFYYFETIDSTNSFLMKSKKSFKNGTLVLSEFQEEGRGRLKRNWQSKKLQNLTFSVILNEKLENYNFNIINLAASLSVANSIENLYQLKPELKWPNDVLINAKKVSGILLESSSTNDKIDKLIIGFGINVNQNTFQGDFNIQPTSIRFELKKEIDREKLLSELLNIFESLIFLSKNNAKKILDMWRDKCRMIGEHVSVTTINEKKYGIFEDIDANGFMILKIADKYEKISYGDVSLMVK